MDAQVNEKDSQTGDNRSSPVLSSGDLRKICLDGGADDTGFVEINREALSSERDDILRVFPRTETIISVVKRVNRESIQSISSSVADYEYAKIHKDLFEIAGEILLQLNARGIRGVAIPPGFPMDMDRWPGKIWEVSHKTVAVEAGVGHMGVHRIVIHPRFGNHILLGAVLTDARLDRYDVPLDENPCIDCGLCVSVCPVRAISRESGVDFISCAMHNYHELFGGFQEWIEKIASSEDSKEYRSQIRDRETLTKWQSLTYGYAYRCSHCMAVCPAGEENVKSYTSDKKRYFQEIVKPLKSKQEPVYVIEGTPAEHAARRNENKDIHFVKNTIRPTSIPTFLFGTKLLFNPEQAKSLKMALNFVFTGKEETEAAISISDGSVSVEEGLLEKADLNVRVDSEAWIKIVNEEMSPLRALITGKMKVKGNPANLRKFKKCIL
jgi:epoxyqueuosine reductase QueG